MAHIATVLIVRADRLSAEGLRDLTRKVLPHSEVEIASCARCARERLAARAVELLITGFDPTLEGDVLGLIGASIGVTGPRVCVIVGHEEGRLLMALPALAVHAVFDASQDEPARFVEALATAAGGGRYWSPSIWPRIVNYQGATNSPEKALTAMERMVLSVIGDGSDDVSAAQMLGVKPMTIASIRRNLHRKLGVQHRGDLVRFAAQNGFVRFTTKGVIRPGFSLLAAACRSPKAKQDSALCA